MNRIAKSPLKLILFGEHSVLIGGRCISVCINKYCVLYMPEYKKKENCINLLIKESNNPVFVFSVGKDSKVMSTSSNYNGIIDIQYFLGCGLGSSAAISILSSIALYHQKKINFYNEKIFKEADTFEDIFHGKSSGVDCATLRYGRMISFKNKKVKKMTAEYISMYKILIYNSNISKDTCKTIKQDLNNKQKNYEMLSVISEKAYELLSRPFKLCELYALIKKAQDIFEDLGVVPEKMKNEVRRLREQGIESKITGAGNGGHLFTIVKKSCSLENWEEVNIDHCGINLINV